MLNHTPRAFFRQTKTTHYCRPARRSSGVNDVGAGKSAVTETSDARGLQTFDTLNALDVRPKSEPLGCAMSPSDPSRHIAPPRDLGRKQSIAEVDGQPSIAEDDARDP